MTNPIKAFREASNMSREDLAEQLQVNVDKIDDWESGERIPSTKYRTLMADVFDVPRHYLVGEIENNFAIKEDGFDISQMGINEDDSEAKKIATIKTKLREFLAEGFEEFDYDFFNILEKVMPSKAGDIATFMIDGHSYNGNDVPYFSADYRIAKWLEQDPLIYKAEFDRHKMVISSEDMKESPYEEIYLDSDEINYPDDTSIQDVWRDLFFLPNGWMPYEEYLGNPEDESSVYYDGVDWWNRQVREQANPALREFGETDESYVRFFEKYPTAKDYVYDSNRVWYEFQKEFYEHLSDLTEAVEAFGKEVDRMSEMTELEQLKKEVEYEKQKNFFLQKRIDTYEPYAKEVDDLLAETKFLLRSAEAIYGYIKHRRGDLGLMDLKTNDELEMIQKMLTRYFGFRYELPYIPKLYSAGGVKEMLDKIFVDIANGGYPAKWQDELGDWNLDALFKGTEDDN